nr:C389 [uncultured bacterium]
MISELNESFFFLSVENTVFEKTVNGLFPSTNEKWVSLLRR